MAEGGGGLGPPVGQHGKPGAFAPGHDDGQHVLHRSIQALCGGVTAGRLRARAFHDPACLPGNLPEISFRIIGVGSDVRTRAELNFPNPLPPLQFAVGGAVTFMTHHALGEKAGEGFGDIQMPCDFHAAREKSRVE